MYIKESVTIGGKELSIETGKMAKQADGSVVVRYGDTMVLVTAVANKRRAGIDFFPLTVEYVEKTYAAGKIPGGFFKREGRPTEREILTCRLIDRPSRPLFPEGCGATTRRSSRTVLSTDKENPTDVLAHDRRRRGAAHLGHPVGRPDRRRPRRPPARRGHSSSPTRPSPSARASDLDLVVAATRDAIVMVEGGAAEALRRRRSSTR